MSRAKYHFADSRILLGVRDSQGAIPTDRKSSETPALCSAQIWDTTAGVALPSTLALLAYMDLQVASTPVYSIGVFPVGPSIYQTTAVNTVLNVQANYTNSSGTMSGQTIPSDANGLTTITAIRIA